MDVSIIETPTHVFEIRITPGADTPGRVRRTATLSVLSGAPLSDEDWQRIRGQCVREMIDAGLRVFRAGCHYEPNEGDDHERR